MNVHHRQSSLEDCVGTNVRTRPIRLLDSHEILHLARGLVVFTPPGNQIAALMDKARKVIPMLTTAEVVRRVTSHNPDCFWAVARRDNFDITSPVGEGYFAFLPLTEQGLRGLLDGSLDRRNPPVSHIVAQNETAAGIYVWHVHAPGALGVGMTLALRKVWSLQNQRVELYAWGTTENVIRGFSRVGFRPLPKIAGSSAPQFHIFKRSSPSNEGASAGAPTQTPAIARLSVRVARSIEDFMRAAAIRGAVYMGEQECPYEEEFDGNDFSSTHLVGYVNDEPAGCMRIRYFADFAKVERLVVRREFRRSGLASEIVRESVSLCESKGYQRVYVYAQKRLVRFWSKCGFVVPSNARELAFSDFDYIEMIHASPRKSDAISEKTDPYIIIRPEGAWQSQGILERSVSRGLRHSSASEVAA